MGLYRDSMERGSAGHFAKIGIGLFVIFLVFFVIIVVFTNINPASSSHNVFLYSGGKLVRSWKSDGKVLGGGSYSWFFTDAATGKYIQVYGDVVIEQQPEPPSLPPGFVR